MMPHGDTIAAIATGAGVSAVGIIRLSGPRSVEIAGEVFRPYTGADMASAPDRKLVYGQFFTPEGAVCDICLCTVSRAPRSYTGEDTAEFQCHGSPAALSACLRAVFAAGARQALAGEFTKRAFLNGRMDLSQAEAVIDLIEAKSETAARNAAGQLAGAVRGKVEAVYSALVDIIAHFFAVVDYPEEDIPDYDSEQYIRSLEDAQSALGRLLATFERGSAVKDGVAAAIIGSPNVGKSSLLNALAGYERAIVSDISGTTRDTIEESVALGGILLRLTDTAGIRDTSDAIESQGVARARDAARDSRLVIAVFDGSRPLTESDREILSLVSSADRRVCVVNKSDLPQRLDISELSVASAALCSISALNGQGLDTLADAVSELFPAGAPVSDGELITNARHAEAIARAVSLIDSAREAMLSGITPDAALSELESALSALGEITGATVRDDMITRIFSRFCVGK
jgi:tRNA modification GTPase